ncbi:chemotaxis protein CheA [Desulfobacterales bacterium HSG16]|nr:chemotaxis protein CheA [Desulfobacterales bacterium HSG16]
MDQHKEVYREEAEELLLELENSLLELEADPDNNQLIDRIFRALHTIKGSGAMFGFDDIANFSHELENTYDHVRNSRIPVTKNLIDMSLAAKDELRIMLSADETKKQNKEDELRLKEIVESFKKLAQDEKLEETFIVSPDRESVSALQINHESDEPVTYRIRFQPDENIFIQGTRPELLLNELNRLGECSLTGLTRDIPMLGEFNPCFCYIIWDIVLTTRRNIDAVRDVFIFVEDTALISIDIIDMDIVEDSDHDYKRIGEILLEKKDITSQALHSTLKEQKRIGQILVDSSIVENENVESALKEQKHVKRIRDKHHMTTGGSSIRVAAEKLDSLVDLVGELVTLQARLNRKAAQLNDTELLSIAETAEYLTGELRESTMSIRMLPFSTTFTKFKRLVRDLCTDLGKTVVLETEGGETELDKNILEQLNDPLVHIIRNAIDHGMESGDLRTSIGKPQHGTVSLKAEHSGAHVIIRVIDDGPGLDTNAIFLKAVQKKMIAPDAELSEKEIHAFILTPGFSTAGQVSGVSGRGVGMDVVKRRIDELRGSTEIVSHKGQGTVIILKLPLTLAIIDGLLVKIEDQHFILPLSVVEECLELERKDVDLARDRNIMDFRGEILTYVSLRLTFDINENLPDFEKVVIVESNGEKIGLGVDQVIGKHQTVIKNLGKIYRDIKEVSGATILGDGTVALILDVNQIVLSAQVSGRVDL